MVITILKAYMIFVIIVMLIYAIRHFVFSYNRLFGRQKLYYNDIYSTKMPYISVLIPMHNEEKVLKYVLDSLLECEYDRDRLEIIPINDNSLDKTKELLDKYHDEYEFIRPLHRDSKDRGKPASLNNAMKVAKGEIIIVFDADYRPARDMLKQLAVGFQNPEVGAVMGRVIPYNANKNLLTRLINLERCGGYQVDQQARYNMGLVPQYGGTVGGFRKDLIVELGGFNPLILAEDTELTYKLFTNGWKVVYANSAECYEEAPETWEVRAKQIRRWARGHNQVLFRYLGKVIVTPYMNLREKVDGILLLFVYAVPFFLVMAHVCSFILFFLGAMNLFVGWWALLFIGAYTSFGNFAPFYEIGTGLMLDGVEGEASLLPFLMINFYFYMWHISLGFIDAIVDVITRRRVKWAKTKRFTESSNKEEESINKEKETIEI
ncbi:glycosyltransferase family 2 protein [Alkalibaculum bacchi]|uniref:glycosyltransferase n=1 Tax=Alkalibaculum bacchi TaxID=645887 RepID=UPI0026E9D76A|nr:glycosyltransferase [Alkalibaculum bacchi]